MFLYWWYKITLIKKTYTNVQIKHNYISNIDLNIEEDLSDNYYGAISKIYENVENWYYLAKWKSFSSTLQYYHKIEIYVINADELLCDAVYLNPFSNNKQWCIPYEKN